jgi:hypothetical protein
MPQPSDLNRNRFLEGMSVAAFQSPGGFLARLLFPVVPSQDETGKYYEFDMDSIARDDFKVRAPGTPIELGTYKVTQRTFGCKQYAYGEKIPEELRAAAGPAADADMAATKVVAEKALISQEVRFGAVYWKTGVWGRDIAGAGADSPTEYVYWNNSAAKPIENVNAESLTMLKKGKRKPNTFALGADVANYLLNHGTIVGRLNNGQTPGGPAEASLADLAKLFKVSRVLVAEGVYNSENEGGTASNSFILNSKSAWLGYVEPSPSVMTPTAGATFTWQGVAGNREGIRVFKRFDPAVRSDIVEMIHNDEFAIVASSLGTFFSNIVQ